MSTSRWGCLTAGVVLLIYLLLRSPVSEAPPAVTGIYRKYGGGSRSSNGSEFLVKIRGERRGTEDANRRKLWAFDAPTPVDGDSSFPRLPDALLQHAQRITTSTSEYEFIFLLRGACGPPTSHSLRLEDFASSHSHLL